MNEHLIIISAYSFGNFLMHTMTFADICASVFSFPRGCVMEASFYNAPNRDCQPFVLFSNNLCYTGGNSDI